MPSTRKKSQALKDKFVDLNHGYIQKMKEDPVAWQNFLARGRALNRMVEALQSSS